MEHQVLHYFLDVIIFISVYFLFRFINSHISLFMHAHRYADLMFFTENLEKRATDGLSLYGSNGLNQE
uniref:SFRICE_007604 n=1 Tax=Spodoptera frugiperda TaxID=7108 RepID=A0A2H1W747_SPOFR